MSEKHEIRDRREQDRFARRGRLIVIGNVAWRWRVGKGATVIAYSEDGCRVVEDAWRICGLSSPDDFDRGKWKRTQDGMVTPKLVEKWLLGKTPLKSLTGYMKEARSPERNRATLRQVRQQVQKIASKRLLIR